MTETKSISKILTGLLLLSLFVADVNFASAFVVDYEDIFYHEGDKYNFAFQSSSSYNHRSSSTEYIRIYPNHLRFSSEEFSDNKVAEAAAFEILEELYGPNGVKMIYSRQCLDLEILKKELMSLSDRRRKVLTIKSDDEEYASSLAENGLARVNSYTLTKGVLLTKSHEGFRTPGIVSLKIEEYSSSSLLTSPWSLAEYISACGPAEDIKFLDNVPVGEIEAVIQRKTFEEGNIFTLCYSDFEGKVPPNHEIYYEDGYSFMKEYYADGGYSWYLRITDPEKCDTLEEAAKVTSRFVEISGESVDFIRLSLFENNIKNNALGMKNSEECRFSEDCDMENYIAYGDLYLRSVVGKIEDYWV